MQTNRIYIFVVFNMWNFVFLVPPYVMQCPSHNIHVNQIHNDSHSCLYLHSSHT